MRKRISSRVLEKPFIGRPPKEEVNKKISISLSPSAWHVVSKISGGEKSKRVSEAVLFAKEKGFKF